MICYCAPLIIIIILNAGIMKSLRRTNPVIQGNDQSNTRHKENQRLIKVLITINVFFFVCWTPLCYISAICLTILPKVLERDTQEMLIIVCLYFLSYVSTAVNPGILFTFSTNYRQALKNLLRLAVVKCRSCLALNKQLVKKTSNCQN